MGSRQYIENKVRAVTLLIWFSWSLTLSFLLCTSTVTHLLSTSALQLHCMDNISSWVIVLLKISFLHIFTIMEIKRKINKSVLESMCADHLCRPLSQLMDNSRDRKSKILRSCFSLHHFLEILNKCEPCRQTCNPSYLGGRRNRMGISKLAWEKL